MVYIHIHICSMEYLVKGCSATNVSVPHTHTAFIVTGHQMVLVIRVVCNTAIYSGNNTHVKHQRVVARPEFGSAIHFVYRKVVGKAGVPHHAPVVKHLSRQQYTSRISTPLASITLIFLVTPATAKNSPSLSNSVLDTMQQLLVWSP